MADSWSSSKLTSKKFTFDWNVSDFERTIAVGNGSRDCPLRSPQYTFSIEPKFLKNQEQVPPDRLAWAISGYVDLTFIHVSSWAGRNVGKQLSSQLSFSLNLSGPSGLRLQAKMVLVVSLLNKKGEVNCSKESPVTSIGEDRYYNTSSKIQVSFGFSDTDLRQQLLADGDLKARCELIVYGKVVHTPVRTKPTYNQSLQTDSELGTRLALLREKDVLTDFTLAVGGKEFKVHKVILAAQSPVFRRMFETDMKEKQEGRSVIEDMSTDVAEELLTFMYTGKAPNVETEELFQLADKYEMDHLKPLCEKALFNNLEVENAVTTLMLADLHSADQLKSVCIGFIEDNISDFERMEGWNQLKSKPQYHDLYMQVLETQLPPPTKKT